jgi:hypothetical protein
MTIIVCGEEGSGSSCIKQHEQKFEDTRLEVNENETRHVGVQINFKHKNTIRINNFRSILIKDYEISYLSPPTVTLRATASSIGCNPLNKRLGIPGLHINRSWSGKLTHQAFAGAHARHHSARGDALHDVFAAPGYEMAVVDNVFLAINKLDFERRWLEGPFI